MATCRSLPDLASFRLFTSQLIVQGSATQGHVAKAFGVPLVAIKRATKLYRERRAQGSIIGARHSPGRHTRFVTKAGRHSLFFSRTLFCGHFC
jgi:hypothetical protein